MKEFFTNIMRGMASIIEVFSSFNIFPPPIKKTRISFKFKNFKDDSEKLKKDWKKVIQW